MRSHWKTGVHQIRATIQRHWIVECPELCGRDGFLDRHLAEEFGTLLLYTVHSSILAIRSYYCVVVNMWAFTVLLGWWPHNKHSLSVKHGDNILFDANHHEISSTKKCWNFCLKIPFEFERGKWWMEKNGGEINPQTSIFAPHFICVWITSVWVQIHQMQYNIVALSQQPRKLTKI